MDRLPTDLFREVVRALRGDHTGVVIVALAVVTMIGMVAGASNSTFAAVMGAFGFFYVLSKRWEREDERRMKALLDETDLKREMQGARKRVGSRRGPKPSQERPEDHDD